MSDDERRLWRAAMRDTEPLRKTEIPSAPGEISKLAPGSPKGQESAPRIRAIPAKLTRIGQGEKPRPSAKSPKPLDRNRPVDIDRKSWERLKKGDVKIDGRIDLHGLTQAEAHRRLDQFLMSMQASGARCVLVITGMGRSDGGILRQMTPRWLAEPSNRERVVTFTQAQLRHGGGGALYVLLRRLRGRS